MRRHRPIPRPTDGNEYSDHQHRLQPNQHHHPTPRPANGHEAYATPPRECRNDPPRSHKYMERFDASSTPEQLASTTETTNTPTTDSTPPDESLPVPADTREYIRIQPTEKSLSPDTVEAHLRRLHQLGHQDGSRLGRLLDRADDRPTIEWLLIAPAEPDASLDYLVGIDDPDARDALERTLRGLVPTTYELERTRKQAGAITAHLEDATTNNGREESTLGAVTYQGCPERRQDWQTCLTPFRTFAADHTESTDHVPLATIAEVMATADAPMVYQALLRPKPDWTTAAADRRDEIRMVQDTLLDKLINALLGRPDEDDIRLSPTDQARLEELAERETRRSFEVNARLAVAGATTAQTERLAGELATAFADVSHTCYEIDGTVATGDAARDISAKIRDRTLDPPRYESLRAKLPGTSTRSPGIVADAREVPNFCLLDGTALTAAGARAVAPTPSERTALPRPPAEQLATYRTEGLLFGRPLTQDGTPDDHPIALPPALQPLHVIWLGKTGSGKSTSLTTALHANQAATDGADIAILPKGEGMATDCLRAHYATHGTFENVLYFDCAEVLPAFSFFDIRSDLEAGVSRTTAVEDKADHYIEILRQIMVDEGFDQAVRSPDVIRYLVKAMFDPVHGRDAFSHRELHEAARQMRDRQTAPAVSDPDLEAMLAGVVANRSQSFHDIMMGVASRIEELPADQRLARVFNHVAGEGDPHFDLDQYLDEDVVIIFDTGALRTEAQRVLTLVVLSNLWSALRRRARRADGAGDHPLVNLYVEEAASVAVSDLLTELLAQARGFDCSVTLSMQFPAQLKAHSRRAYDEVLNNVSTVVTGAIPDDRRLAARLATDDLPVGELRTRLRALRRGRWLVSLAAAFGEPQPRPFLVQSPTPPLGVSAGQDRLSATQRQRIDSEIETLLDRTCLEAGLPLKEPSTTADADAAADDGTDAGTAEDNESASPVSTRVHTALPHTKRLPPTVTYDGQLYALRCTECDTRYDPDIDGMKRAIECCSSLEDVDRDDIPVCDLYLKLTRDEREATDWSDRQLMFLQAVYNAQQLRYDPLEYDLLRDSMLRLQEYVGIDSDAVQDLIDEDLLRHDTDHPHRLFTVTPEGRSVIGESYRQGVDYGHGVGDLEESSQHVLAVEVGRRYLLQEYVEDPDSPVTEVIPYYDLTQDETLSAAAFMGSEDDAAEAVEEYEQRRLDVAGLDDDGEIVVALEAERVNHDYRRAVPDDFDKLAACGVEEAIWVVMSQSAGHDVLQALNDPLDGEPRVEKTYAETSPPQKFRIDTPGLTAMYPVEWLRNRVVDS